MLALFLRKKLINQAHADLPIIFTCVASLLKNGILATPSSNKPVIR